MTLDELATTAVKVSRRESQALSVDRIAWMIRSAAKRGVSHYKRRAKAVALYAPGGGSIKRKIGPGSAAVAP
jgi:hypothetical protein